MNRKTEKADGLPLAWGDSERAVVEATVRWAIERLEAIERANSGRPAMGQRRNTAIETRRVINRLRDAVSALPAALQPAASTPEPGEGVGE